MVRIALFASGNGSNVENLYRVFDQHPRIQFPVLICNRENAPVVKLAQGFKKKYSNNIKTYPGAAHGTILYCIFKTRTYRLDYFIGIFIACTRSFNSGISATNYKSSSFAIA